jgi:hypothetical protein
MRAVWQRRFRQCYPAVAAVRTVVSAPPNGAALKSSGADRRRCFAAGDFNLARKCAASCELGKRGVGLYPLDAGRDSSAGAAHYFQTGFLVTQLLQLPRPDPSGRSLEVSTTREIFQPINCRFLGGSTAVAVHVIPAARRDGSRRGSRRVCATRPLAFGVHEA